MRSTSQPFHANAADSLASMMCAKKGQDVTSSTNDLIFFISPQLQKQNIVNIEDIQMPMAQL